MAEGLQTRQAALALLNGVLGEGRPLSDLDATLSPLPPQERARAQRLALQCLRQMEPIDRLLSPSLRKSPPLEVMNTLRLAVTELHDGAAAHGVVNSAVEITRRGKHTSRLAGLVNAVLRAVPPGAPLSGPPQRLPRWLRQPLVQRLGRDAVTAIESVQAQTPPVDLTLHGDVLPEGRLLPTGSLRLTTAGQISTLPGYANGHWWVQDAAAALAVPMLGPVRGLRVLDLCAAPGGKTLQLAAAGAQVTALDISGPRMARLAENLQRTGLQARLITADALHWQPDAPFDAVLLDAPCSATGTIRRHPDLPFVKDGSEITALATLQAQLLDRALTFLRPGGRLVYATCSLLAEEGEDQLAAVLARHPDLGVLPTAISGVPEHWFTNGALRTRPDYWTETGGMDGFFMVCLTR